MLLVSIDTLVGYCLSLGVIGCNLHALLWGELGHLNPLENVQDLVPILAALKMENLDSRE